MSDAKNTDRPETFLNSFNPEDLHRFLFEEAADGMFITDPQSRLLAVNPRGTELIGYALEELVGMTITELIPTDELARDPIRMDELRQGKIVLKERQFRRKDGSLLPVEISARMLPGGQLLGHVRDITKRKRAERALRDREQHLRLLTDNMVDAISQVDAERSVVYCSPSVERVFGIKQADLIGRNAYDRVHPEDAESLRQQAMGAIASHAALIRAEYRYLHGRGEYVWVESSIRLLFAENGEYTGAVNASRDITERKHAEERLRERENLLSSIFRAAPTGIGMVSNRRLLAVNDRICEMIGFSREELIGKKARVLYPSDADFEYVGSEKYRQIAERGTGTVETRWECKDGRIIDVLLSSTPINPLDLSGGVTFTALDITERKRSEDALRWANLVVENSPVVLFRWKAAEGWPVDMVSQNSIQFGYTPEELLSGAVRFASMVHPEDLDRVAREVQEYSATGMDRFQQEYRIVTKDGAVRWVDDRTVAVRNIHGQIVFYQGIVIDITERQRAKEALRESERRLRLALKAGNQGFYDLNMQTGEAGVSPEYATMLGYDPAEFHETHAAWLERLHPDDRKPVAAVYRDYITGKIPEYQVEFRQRTQSGAWKWILSIGKIVERDDRGEPLRMLGTHTDITKRKKAEEEKDALRGQLQQAQKMESVGRLAGGVAHDFNNMLSAILGHAELAMMQYSPSEPLQDDLKAIKRAAQRSADLVRQLLAFARKQTVAPKVLDFNDTVSGMLKMLRQVIGEDIDLVWMPEAGLWPVKIDPSQLDQLLANLCVNARDAIAGVGKVTIETENIAFDEAYCAVHPGFACGEYVKLAVSDDGCGMNKEVLDHLFEPFFTTKEVGKGTGLGLATVYGIVKQNEGFVSVYSEPDKGTTFKIYLPRFVGDAVEPMAASPAETPMGRGETVLLVEDEAAILNVGRAMLQRLGYTVLTAGTPGEALRQAEAHAAEIRLLITDVVMPEMNGRDLTKLIRDIKPGLKCLFTSGYTANVIAHHGVLDKGVNFLQKPFSMKELASKVRQALER